MPQLQIRRTVVHRAPLVARNRHSIPLGRMIDTVLDAFHGAAGHEQDCGEHAEPCSALGASSHALAGRRWAWSMTPGQLLEDVLHTDAPAAEKYQGVEPEIRGLRDE